MTELTAYERSLVEVVEELRDCPEIEVYEDNIGALEPNLDDARSALAEVENREGITLDPSFQECFFRFEELRSTWGTPDELFAGEFFVENIHKALIDAMPPPLWYDPSPEELRLQSELRAVDMSDTGSGWLTAISIQPGVANCEVWFDFDRRMPGYWKLDIDYAGYLAALRVTKGTSGWQLLFADASLRDDEFDWVVDSLRSMLETFPDLFPKHDYEPLRRRLEERLSRRR
ncbi:hypothetical protein [Streptomyces nigrescens]